MSMFRQPLLAAPTGGSGLPIRLVTAGDDMATTILDLTRELKITLLALGEPPGDKRRAELIRRVLSRVLASTSAPVLFVPAGAKERRDPIRRILLVLHQPYPAMDLVHLAIPLARRNHAELRILTLPSATPFIPDLPPVGTVHPSLVCRAFDAGAWLERECARQGYRTRAVSSDGDGVLRRVGHEHVGGLCRLEEVGRPLVLALDRESLIDNDAADRILRARAADAQQPVSAGIPRIGTLSAPRGRHGCQKQGDRQF